MKAFIAIVALFGLVAAVSADVVEVDQTTRHCLYELDGKLGIGYPHHHVNIPKLVQQAEAALVNKPSGDELKDLIEELNFQHSRYVLAFQEQGKTCEPTRYRIDNKDLAENQDFWRLVVVPEFGRVANFQRLTEIFFELKYGAKRN